MGFHRINDLLFPGRRRNEAAEAEERRADDLALSSLCQCSVQEALARLKTAPAGLGSAEAEARLAESGPNTFAPARTQGVVADIFDRFKNPLVIQLLVICIVSFLMHDLRSAIVVAGMIVLSVALAFVQERRSNKAAQSLQKLVQTSAIALRDGAETQVTVDLLVPGDVLSLAAGSIIPADIRLLSVKDFFVSQSALTGESMPVEKHAAADAPGPATETLELADACFQGSTVVSGTGQAVVVRTGRHTFLGSISRNLTTKKESTAFDKGVQSFVWLMVKFMIIMVSLTFLIVGITKHDWIEALLFGLAVAVGLTPEMLPMIMSVCLSKGAIAMSRRKVIVKKLKSIQNLGSMDILCTDK
ncbi:MAG: HAD-IC family P-type ATPase, partial [Chitinispirillaceae bacterium]